MLKLFLSICKRNQQHGTHVDKIWEERSKESQMCKQGKLIKLGKKIVKTLIQSMDVKEGLSPHVECPMFFLMIFTWPTCILGNNKHMWLEMFKKHTLEIFTWLWGFLRMKITSQTIKTMWLDKEKTFMLLIAHLSIWIVWDGEKSFKP